MDIFYGRIFVPVRENKRAFLKPAFMGLSQVVVLFVKSLSYIYARMCALPITALSAPLLRKALFVAVVSWRRKWESVPDWRRIAVHMRDNSDFVCRCAYDCSSWYGCCHRRGNVFSWFAPGLSFSLSKSITMIRFSVNPIYENYMYNATLAAVTFQPGTTMIHPPTVQCLRFHNGDRTRADLSNATGGGRPDTFVHWTAGVDVR